MKLYKLTDANDQTRGHTQWGEDVEHTAPGGGDLCSYAYLHAYTSPLIAVMMDPIQGGFGPDAHLWEADGDVEIDDGTKVGSVRLRTLRQIPLPVLTTEQRVIVAIRCAQLVMADTHCPDWSTWAAKWIDGIDRSAAEAWDAAAAAWEAEAEAAARAARAAAAAEQEAEQEAAARAARAARAAAAAWDLHEIIEAALTSADTSPTPATPAETLGSRGSESRNGDAED